MNDSRRAGRAMPVLAALVGLLLSACGGGGGGVPVGPNDPIGDGNPSTITSVDPAVGPAAGGTVLTISGQGFVEDVTTLNVVRVGGVEATNVVTLDDGTITAVVPAGTPAFAADVEVVNSRGVARLGGGFFYLALPENTSDLNGDGIADMAIGSPRDDEGGNNSGAAYVFFGSDSGGLADTTADGAGLKLIGTDDDQNFGFTLATGDLDGDDQDDLVVGANLDDSAGENVGAVYVFLGPLGLEPLLLDTQADLKITGDPAVTGDLFGSSLSMGDIDDDGQPELLVGAPRHDIGGNGAEAVADAGRVYVFQGGPGLSATTFADASYVIDGQEEGAGLGNAVGNGDLNADGIQDLIVAASHMDPVLPPKTGDAGTVSVFLGPVGGGANASAADVTIPGTELNDEFGHSLITGDMDQDGIDDLMVGTPLHDTLGSNVGRVFIFLGSETFADRWATDADHFIEGQPANGAFGADLTCGDVNADGRADLVIGAREASYFANGNGRAYVFFGGDGFGDSVATLADVIFTGETEQNQRFGACIRVGDVNGDGYLDVLSGAPLSLSGAGRTFLFHGEQFMADRFADDDDVTYTGEAAGNQFGAAMVDGQ